MSLAYLSPLPPTRSGISVYSAMLLPALAKRVDVVAVAENPSVARLSGVPVISRGEYAARRGEFDDVIYQLGNNPYHEWIYREAYERSGVVVLHDLVLHHLIVEMTLARGLGDEYVTIMRDNHGEAGEAWARGRVAGFHDELGNFLFPASRHIAQFSRGVIVHNHYASGRLRALGVDRPITIAPMSFDAVIDTSGDARRRKRAELGIGDDVRLIGMFGFVTASKRPEQVLSAFALASRRATNIGLLIVGEPAPNCDLPAMIAEHGVDPAKVHTSGFVSEEEFDAFLAASDRVVNLRYPTAGETSGALLRIFAAGRPVAVSDLAQFTEFPSDVATRIPLGEGEVTALSEFMLAPDDPFAREAQRGWLKENAGVTGTVDAYIEALSRSVEVSLPPNDNSPLPLFPRLSLEGFELTAEGVSVRLRNSGDTNLRAAVYGTPGYRTIAKVYAGAREVQNFWISLDSDLHPGDETILRVKLHGLDEGELRLHHALEGIPQVDDVPFAVIPLRVPERS